MAKKKNKKKKLIDKQFSLKELIPIIVISILIGAIVGGVITYNKENISIIKVPKELEEFVEVYENISENYYGKVKKNELVNSAISGMISSLDDPYSVFLDKDNTSKFNETVDGEYVGIGATVSYSDEEAKVLEVFDSSPAKKAGLKKDDVIIKVDGKDITKKNLSEITNMIKGKKNTIVSLTVKRKNTEKLIKIKRGDVETPIVTSKVINNENHKVGYISISSFSSNSYEQFKSNLSKLENKKIESLIIDVRNNPGGHLNQVTDIIELFTQRGKVLYEIEQKGKVQKIYDMTNEMRKYKIAILTNKSSASASEVLASSLKNNNQALLVGKKTYGKGTVQKAYQLSNGTTVKYTTQKWLTSKGKWLNKKGLPPDYEVDLGEDYASNPIDENDAQLNKAISVLTQKEEK